MGCCFEKGVWVYFEGMWIEELMDTEEVVNGVYGYRVCYGVVVGGIDRGMVVDE